MPTTNSNDRANPPIALPGRNELLTRLIDNYGVPRRDVEDLDRSRLMGVVDTFDFLVQHLPVEGAVEAARATLPRHIAPRAADIAPVMK